MHATGQFNVRLPAHPVAPDTEAAQLGRKAIHKTFAGDLQGSSLGEMLNSLGTVPGSAGYVALEKFEGTLDGRRGSFVLMHYGVMDRGQSSLHIQVLPDSATGELQGLSGRMQIHIHDGQHDYAFDYSLPAAP
ncbi:DUF3224 domain-containing protein [Pseudomonas sp. LD120]|uniref:DUF3224 domain-containing protein n=1 Tax=Pseudomonas sp. LD120 TaxID=485751 RepID=UPI001C49A00E|nr:DUF3224 domain-containing protein [Pseudomonas sp. LD120]